MIGQTSQRLILKQYLCLLCIIASFFVLSSCQHRGLDSYKYKQLSKDDRGNHHYKGHYKVGNHYKIQNKVYKPKEVKQYTQVGIASWYGAGDGCHGNKTANGDKYNKNLLTAAHPTIQLPSLVKVTNLENNKSVVVLVNDRGPYKSSRIIDVSERAAEILHMKHKGVAKVKVQYLHADSRKFIDDMRLQVKHGSVASGAVKNKHCTINCHIKVANLRHGIDLKTQY